MNINDDWYVQCECTDCHCYKYVNITQADEDGDYLRVCNDCMWKEHTEEVPDADRKHGSPT